MPSNASWRTNGGVTLPSHSQAQQRLFAIAEHEPGKLFSKNRGLAKLPKKTLHDFASTKRKGLPARKHKMADLYE